MSNNLLQITGICSQLKSEVLDIVIMMILAGDISIDSSRYRYGQVSNTCFRHNNEHSNSISCQYQSSQIKLSLEQTKINTFGHSVPYFHQAEVQRGLTSRKSEGDRCNIQIRVDNSQSLLCIFNTARVHTDSSTCYVQFAYSQSLHKVLTNRFATWCEANV